MSLTQKNLRRRILYLIELIDKHSSFSRILNHFCLLIDDIDDSDSSYVVCADQWTKIINFVQTKLQEHSSEVSEEYNRVFNHLALSYNLGSKIRFIVRLIKFNEFFFGQQRVDEKKFANFNQDFFFSPTFIIMFHLGNFSFRTLEWWIE